MLGGRSTFVRNLVPIARAARGASVQHNLRALSISRIARQQPATPFASVPIPQVQSQAPAVSGRAVVDGEIRDFSLDQCKGKWIVLFFYPLDFTFVCPTEIIAFDQKLDAFRQRGAEVIGVSVDSEFCHLAWTQRPRKEGGLGRIRYPLVSDLRKSISSSYQVLTSAGFALRGTFIIDPNGVIRQSSVNDAPVGRNVDEVLRTLDALQFVAKHGEVCPANWEEGGKTIKPSPTESKEYFEAAN